MEIVVKILPISQYEDAFYRVLRHSYGVQGYLCKLSNMVSAFEVYFYTANDIWFCVAFPRFAGMGNLLKVLTREIENYPHFFLDFESKF